MLQDPAVGERLEGEPAGGVRIVPTTVVFPETLPELIPDSPGDSRVVWGIFLETVLFYGEYSRRQFCSMRNIPGDIRAPRARPVAWGISRRRFHPAG